MLEYISQWIENVAFYMIVVTVAVQALPNNSYKKYIQFFTGLILILMLSAPVLKIFGAEQTFRDFYESEEYRQNVREIEQAAEYMEGMLIED